MTRHTVEILRPIEEVFAVLTDVTLTGRWYPAKVEEWWLTPPPHGVGSIRRARVIVMGGRAAAVDAEMVPFGERDADSVGQLTPRLRPRGLSLGDRACVALALRAGAPALTAERSWGELDLPGLVVELIR